MKMKSVLGNIQFSINLQEILFKARMSRELRRLNTSSESKKIESLINKSKSTITSYGNLY